MIPIYASKRYLLTFQLEIEEFSVIPFLQQSKMEKERNDNSSSTASGKVLASGINIKQEVIKDGTLYQRNLDKILDHYTKRYEAQPKKRQTKKDEKFNRKLQKLVDFHRKYGHWEVPSSTGKKLYDWVGQLHRLFQCAYYNGLCYKSHILPRHRYEKLVAIGFPFEFFDRQDMMKCNKAGEDGNTSSTPAFLVPPSTTSSTSTSNKKIKDEEYDTNLFTQEFKRNLDELDKVLDKCTERDTSKRLLENRSQEENATIANVRRSKRNIEKNQKKAVSIRISKDKEEDKSEERGPIYYKRNLNNAINGYTQRFEKLSEKQRKTFDGKFIVNFKRLVEFQSKFGHYNVSKAREEYKPLYNWVFSIQRTFRRAYYHGKDGENFKLTRDRYNRLVAIGFPFNDLEGDENVSANLRLQSKKSSSTAEENSKETRPSRYEACDKPTIIHRLIIPKNKNAATATTKTSRKRRQTNTSKEGAQSLKVKIMELERENESHYDTIYRLKDEKESLVEKVEEQNTQIDTMKQKLETYRKRVESLEQSKMESTSSSSSKRQRTCSESSNAEVERLQKEKQLLNKQLKASTKNHRKILDSSSSSSKRKITCSDSSIADIERLQQEKQLLTKQLKTSLKSYRKILDLVPCPQSK